jgi:predicted secreted protein
MEQAGMKDRCSEAQSEIILHPGEEHCVVLGGLGSAGYVWEFEVDEPSGVIAVRSGLSSAKVPAHANHSRLQTYSVEHTFIIDALKPGKAEVRFLLRRPWQKDAPSARTVTIHVTVAE